MIGYIQQLTMVQTVLLSTVIGLGTLSLPNTVKYLLGVLGFCHYNQRDLGKLLDIVWYCLVTAFIFVSVQGA